MSHNGVSLPNRGLAGPGQPRRPRGQVPLYLQVLPANLLRVIAVGSLVMAMLVILLAMYHGEHFEHDIARFMLCLAVATSLAVFFFIFYPDRLELQLPLSVGMTIRFAGPAALWLGVVLFLWHYIPVPESGRVFQIWHAGQHGGMILGDDRTTYFTVKEGKPPEYALIGAPDGTRNLYGIYVVFPTGVRSIDADLHHVEWAEPLHVVLTRDQPAVIEISDAKERSSP